MTRGNFFRDGSQEVTFFCLACMFQGGVHRCCWQSAWHLEEASPRSKLTVKAVQSQGCCRDRAEDIVWLYRVLERQTARVRSKFCLKPALR
jgi:hypothetical protein